MLIGREQFYPHLLEVKFPRVFSKLIELLDTQFFQSYLRALIMDNRSGNRAGFPPEVAREIMRLSNFVDEVLNKDKQVNAWDQVVWEDDSSFNRYELERYGFDLSPQGFLKSVERNHQEAIQIFLSSGVNLESQDERNWTPLMVAASNGNDELCSTLIQCGSRVSAKDKNGYTPLHWAAYNGHTHVAKLLLEKEAEVNEPSSSGWTPLMQAATRGHHDTCTYLIENRADVNLATSDGWTALHKSANNGHIEIVKLLLNNGANRFAKYQDGRMPVDLAIKAEHLDIAALLKPF
jgi:hypothetical protein